MFCRGLRGVSLMGNSTSTLNDKLLILSLPHESSWGAWADLFLRCNFLLRTLALRFCDRLSASGALRRSCRQVFLRLSCARAYKHNGTLRIRATTRLDRPG